MGSSLRRWLSISFLNLLIVAFLGVILRYKIAFSLPFVDQKNLHHGHSHFAFFGWITMVLMVLMVHYLQSEGNNLAFRKYRWLLFINLLSAYGMLVSFSLQGYGTWSIGFSTLSTFVSYLFAVLYWRDLSALKIKRVSHLWFKAALFFAFISSFGAYAEAYLMINRIIHQNWYLASEYYYLHFQYNGWFFFAGMGLLFSRLEKFIAARRQLKTIFWLFCFACLPAFFLSALWMSIPMFVYWLVIASAIAQVVGWGMLINLVIKNKNTIPGISKKGRQVFFVSAIALTIKLLLQLGSTHPALSQLAFGFRPIVIGYLHLVLLGVISIFILGYIISLDLLTAGKYFMTGIWIFIAGIILNELLLMLQGVTGMSYIIIPGIKETLLAAAIIMFSGILIINLNNRLRENNFS